MCILDAEYEKTRFTNSTIGLEIKPPSTINPPCLREFFFSWWTRFLRKLKEKKYLINPPLSLRSKKIWQGGVFISRPIVLKRGGKKKVLNCPFFDDLVRKIRLNVGKERPVRKKCNLRSCDMGGGFYDMGGVNVITVGCRFSESVEILKESGLAGRFYKVKFSILVSIRIDDRSQCM